MSRATADLPVVGGTKRLGRAVLQKPFLEGAIAFLHFFLKLLSYCDL